MVSTSDSESENLGSIPNRTFISLLSESGLALIV